MFYRLLVIFTASLCSHRTVPPYIYLSLPCDFIITYFPSLSIYFSVILTLFFYNFSLLYEKYIVFR